MIDNDPQTYPMLLTDEEACRVLRMGRRTLQRQAKAGTLGMQPIKRGRQSLWKRHDVWRLLGIAEQPVPKPVEKSRVNVPALMALHEARKLARRAKPK